MSIVASIQSHLDTGQFSKGVFVDLKITVDTVEHVILLHKLEYYGIRVIAKQWFESYLSKRKQYVVIG